MVSPLHRDVWPGDRHVPAIPADPSSLWARPGASGPVPVSNRRFRRDDGGGPVANPRNRDVRTLSLRIGGLLTAGSDAEHGVVYRPPCSGRAHDPKPVDPGLHHETRGERAPGGGGDHEREWRVSDPLRRPFHGHPGPAELATDLAPVRVEHTSDVTERVLMHGGEDTIEVVAADKRHEDIAHQENPNSANASHLREHLTIPNRARVVREDSTSRIP